MGKWWLPCEVSPQGTTTRGQARWPLAVVAVEVRKSKIENSELYATLKAEARGMPARPRRSPAAQPISRMLRLFRAEISGACLQLSPDWSGAMFPGTFAYVHTGHISAVDVRVLWMHVAVLMQRSVTAPEACPVPDRRIKVFIRVRPFTASLVGYANLVAARGPLRFRPSHASCSSTFVCGSNTQMHDGIQQAACPSPGFGVSCREGFEPLVLCQSMPHVYSCVDLQPDAVNTFASFSRRDGRPPP